MSGWNGARGAIIESYAAGEPRTISDPSCESSSVSELPAEASVAGGRRGSAPSMDCLRKGTLEGKKGVLLPAGANDDDRPEAEVEAEGEGFGASRRG